MSRRPRLGALASIAFALSAACGVGVERPEGWSEESHGKKAAPAYDVVFPASRVNRFDLVLTPEDWRVMQDDMTGMLGAFGAGGGGAPGGGAPGGGGGAPAELTQACEGKAAGDACTATFMGNTFTSTCAPGRNGAPLLCQPARGGGGGPGGPGGGGPGGGGGGGGDIVPNTPVYVPATFKFEGKTWPQVGVRMKGNSSLGETWRRGVGKLPLRLHFEKYKEAHPETDGQRFYGFKKLSLGNGAADTSLMRDKVTADVYRAFGVPAPTTGFVALYVDHGGGPEYWGLYTLDEDADNNSLLDRHFGDHDGPLYEADGVGARWQAFDEASFALQKNEEQGWGPVQEAIAALNADRTDAAAWRAGLEARLDVPGFLRWLAINTVMQNWDAYGGMAHNYYLYAHPQEGHRLHWISWDHDRSMGEGMGRSTSITQETTDASWPLIRLLMDDPTYAALYRQYLLEAVDGPASPDALRARITSARDTIAPWAVGENAERTGFTFLSTPESFETAISGTTGLLNFAAKRQADVKTALGVTP
ncbi:CotH kinase family protein [Archangium primigenium]|uniref:CotH kinase family protein n=1 Tax=[Archangium] primigenium TaxID=2792470 RepID=UPI00195A9C53|nr:CotH kinase family protein [Archangium primigenium]MBM7118348.1 CotH kinase family protein [Archangium primigenium]